MMYYRIDENNNIIDCSKFEYEGSLETEKNIVRDFNGKLVFEEETQTEEYLTAKQNLETKQDNQKRVAKLTEQLQKTDYIANKLAEANAEYIVTGDNTNVLALREEYKVELQNRASWRQEINKLENTLKN